MKTLLFIISFLALITTIVNGETITLTENTVISKPEVYDSVTCTGNITVQMNGGYISGTLWGQDTSCTYIYDGQIHAIYSSDSSSVTLYDGVVNSGYGVASWGSGVFNMYGGIVGILNADQDSIMNIYGGIIADNTNTCENSILNIRGGIWLDYMAALNTGDSVINIYGKDFQYISSNGLGSFGQLSDGGTIIGLWSDGTSFSIDLMDHLGDSTFYDHVVLHEIPEPCTLLLLAFGGLMIRKR